WASGEPFSPRREPHDLVSHGCFQGPEETAGTARENADRACWQRSCRCSRGQGCQRASRASFRVASSGRIDGRPRYGCELCSGL
ncbi:Hypothetical Protein FCC1311_008362, partial [Hondaea fermentalgiana]